MSWKWEFEIPDLVSYFSKPNHAQGPKFLEVTLDILVWKRLDEPSISIREIYSLIIKIYSKTYIHSIGLIDFKSQEFNPNIANSYMP